MILKQKRQLLTSVISAIMENSQQHYRRDLQDHGIHKSICNPVPSLSLSIELPPAGWVQPKLALNYNSGLVDEMKNKQFSGIVDRYRVGYEFSGKYY